MNSRALCVCAGLALLVPPTCSAQGTAPVASDVPAAITGFVAERDRLLMSPAATADDYRSLVRTAGASLSIPSLSLGDLSKAAFAGMLDESPAREEAAARAAALQAAPDADGARAAVVRLRLLGARALGASPKPADVTPLVKLVMEHPGLEAAWKSPAAGEIVTALLSTGDGGVLQPYAETVLNLVATLEPGQLREGSVRLADAALLADIVSPAPGAFTAPMKALLAKGEEAQKGPGPDGAAPQLDEDVQAIQALLRDPVVVDFYAGDPRLQMEGGLKGVLRRGGPSFTDAKDYFLFGATGSARLNRTLISHFNLHNPPYDTVIRLDPDYYIRPDHTTFAPADAVAPLGGPVRLFGGLKISGPLVVLKTADAAYDPATSKGFAEKLSIASGSIRATAESAEIDGRNATFKGVTAKLNLGFIPLATAKAEDAFVEGNSFVAKEPKLSLFTIPITKLPDVSISLAETGERKKAEGKSPLSSWLKMPSVGVYEGGLALKYRNALKFGGRWTAIPQLAWYANAPEAWSLGVNYNFQEVTDNTDTFYTQPQLTQTYLGSFFFTAANQRPMQENHLLTRSTLFGGISTATNQFYTTPDNDTREVDIPLSIGLQGSQLVGGKVGVLGQLTYEKVDEGEAGVSTRGNLNGAVGPPLLHVFRGTDLFLRGDGGTLFGQDGGYSWYRGIAGLTGLITPKFRLSSAYYSSGESGTPPTDFDEVPAGSGFTLRGDINVSKWAITGMNQYDTQRDEWTRFQVFVAYRGSIMQPFVGYDERANSYTFGLKAYFGEALNEFMRRGFTGVETSD